MTTIAFSIILALLVGNLAALPRINAALSRASARRSATLAAKSPVSGECRLR
jgi:hypothetical protein